MSTPLLAAVLLLAVPENLCTTVPPMLYSEIVGTAEQIVIGTATGSTCAAADGGKTIRTHVTFERLTWLKGAADPTLTLQLEGGRIGEDRLLIPAMPEFRVGARYLLYVAHNKTNLSPIVGFYQGAFEIVQRDGKELLVGQNGLELIGVRDDRFVFAAKPPRPSVSAPAPIAVPIAGFVPRPAAKDVDRLQAEERARIEAHDGARREGPLPERGDAAMPGRRASNSEPPPARAPQSVLPGRAVVEVDKSPILVPADQDRGDRTSVQTLLDTVSIPGRK